MVDQLHPLGNCRGQDLHDKAPCAVKAVRYKGSAGGDPGALGGRGGESWYQADEAWKIIRFHGKREENPLSSPGFAMIVDFLNGKFTTWEIEKVFFLGVSLRKSRITNRRC